MTKKPNTIRSAFSEFLQAENKEGSGKASSYIRAIDLLAEMLHFEAYSFNDCLDIWSITSPERLSDLRELVLAEQQKTNSPWRNENIPASYLDKNHCSAALSKLVDFLPFHIHSTEVLGKVRSHQGNDDELADRLDFSPYLPKSDKYGQDVIRKRKTRIGQYAFREMILSIYRNRCCITGLDIPQINRASHIIPWKDNSKTRMDPCNGLCLSATYDAAFDNHFISLDENYCLLVSRDITDHYSSSSVKEYFLDRLGQQITLPPRFLPNPEFLAKHRKIIRL